MTPTEATAPSTATPVTADGFGPVKLGYTVDEARRATGRPLRYTPPDPAGPACGALDLGVSDVTVDVIPDSKPGPARIARITSLNASLRSDKGPRIGSTAAEVRTAYPTATQGNSEQSVALVINGSLGALQFRFGTDFGQPIPPTAKVIAIAAARSDIATYDELCA